MDRRSRSYDVKVNMVTAKMVCISIFPSKMHNTIGHLAIMFISVLYRRISQMTYWPKSVGKMADHETLTFRISLDSDQICTYFLKDIVCRVLSVLGKKFEC